MITANEYLNKIKWDKREKPDEYALEYLDFGRLVPIKYTDIKRIDEGFMAIDKNGKETMIPLHRIKIIKKQGDIVWQRK
ncbi:DUF504 domain-containing protein [Candidatus Woesearchaeota archaeon]|nr:DUF504 domain-containing protein [Candidatus Woesearchaeota archaeon]